MDTETRETTAERMRDLARSVAADLQTQADFEVDEYLTCLKCGEDAEDHDGTDHRFQGEEIPNFIIERLGSALEDIDLEDLESELDTAYESWREDYLESSVLDVSAVVSVIGQEIQVRTVTLVLGTGGPHVEVTLDEDGDGEVTAYDWWREGETSQRVSISGHPLTAKVAAVVEMIEREC